jgi:serralysin
VAFFVGIDMFDRDFLGIGSDTGSGALGDFVLHQEACSCAECMGGSDKQAGNGGSNAPDTVPGDTTSTASVPVGGSVQGSIDTAGDSDWYRITLVAGQTYTFSTILGGLSDSILTLRNASGTVLATNDDAVAGSSSYLFSEITFLAPSSGTYFLDVTGYQSATGSFYLTTTAPTADSIAGSASTGSSLTIGAAATNGNIDANGDHDWFAVQVVAGQTYLFTTTTTGGADIDTTLMLRNGSGALLAYNDDSSGTFSRIRYTATTTGTLYLDVGAWANGQTGDYRVQAEIAPPLQVFTNDQIATQLTNTYWGGSTRRFNVQAGGTLTVNVTALTAEGQFLAREALGLWSDATGLTFSEVTTGGQIVFDDDESGAFATSTRSGSFITSSEVNVSTDWLTTNGTTLRSYSFQTYVHEIGHALGLGHGGPYNSAADYAQDAAYLNDAWVTTVMSYFDQVENTYFANGGFTRQFTVSPMVADIVAATNLYGTATTTRTGDTTYGFNNNSGRAIYDAVVGQTAVSFTVVDHGGTDTLDFSGYSSAQRIFLESEWFSSVGGRVGNMSISRGSVIENAIGGSGEDIIIGNAVANNIRGGASRDGIQGEGGNDTIFGDAGIDYLLGGAGSDMIDGGADADEILGGDGNDTLIGGTDFFTDILSGEVGDDILRGDSTLGDYDIMSGGLGDDIFYVDTPFDLTNENASEGTDTVFANVNGTGYFLGGNVENLTLMNTTQFGVGNALDNILIGSDAANGLYGRDGNDALNGGRGNDSLYGEGGADIFVVQVGTGSDTIGDFQRGVDRVDLSSFGITGLAQLQQYYYQDPVSGAGAIQFGTGDVLIFVNTQMSQLTAADFIFAISSESLAKPEIDIMDAPKAFGADAVDVGTLFVDNPMLVSEGLQRWQPVYGDMFV